MKKNNCIINITRTLWAVVIILGVIGVVTTTFVIITNFNLITSFKENTENASSFGSFFGGFIGTIFAITGTILLLVTLITQHIENQKKQTENNFFRMVDYHTENVKQMNVSDIDPNKKTRSTGRRAFVIFKKQIEEINKSWLCLTIHSETPFPGIVSST